MMKKLVLLSLALQLFSGAFYSQTFQWTKRAGLWAYDLGHAIGSDANGNVYIAGKYEMNANFGGTTVSCAGNHDIYVAKYTSTGNFLWVRTAGGSTGDYAHALAVDGSGNVYVTGEFEGTTTFTPGVALTSNGDNDIFVAKYNTNGVLQWAKKLGGGSLSDKGLGIALIGSDIYITGKFEGTGNFAGVTMASGGGKEVFLAKYTNAGVFQWVKKAGGSGSDEGAAVSTDASGNVFVTGWFSGTANFGGVYLTSKGGKDIFVAKYNSSGSVIWAKKFGGSYDDFGRGIKVDNSGRIFITGGFRYKCTFGTTTLTATGGSDVFVARIDANGNAVWAKKAGGTIDDEAMAIAADGSSNVFITGRFGKTATFSGTTLYGVDSSEVFFAAYDQSGNFKWALGTGGSADPSAPGKDPEMGLSIATDPSGNILGSGTYRSSSTFGNVTLAPWSNTDIFITKISQGSSIAGKIAAPRVTPTDSASYCIGSYVTLTVDQEYPSEIRWLNNGVLIEGASGSNYRARSPGLFEAMIIQLDDTIRTGATHVTETKQILSTITVPPNGFCIDSVAFLTAPTGEGYMYQWKRNGRNIPGATSHTYQPERDGSYRVKVIQGSCFDWSSPTDVVIRNCANDTTVKHGVTGIANLDTEDSLIAVKVYPNPNSGLFNLELNFRHMESHRGEMKIQVINSTGILYYEKIITDPGSYVKEEVSLDGNARPGIYFLNIYYGEFIDTNKIMLLR